MTELHLNQIETEKLNGEASEIQREKSLENSQTSSTEDNHSISLAGKLALREITLSRNESATNAVYDPASKVPTNASRESGIIGFSATI
jgi:hypothetical protein